MELRSGITEFVEIRVVPERRQIRMIDSGELALGHDLELSTADEQLPNLSAPEAKFLAVLDSYCEDSDGNGKIDRIRVLAEERLNHEFQGMSVRVAGYTLTDPAYTSAEPEKPDMFFIHLLESSYLDTGATPTWWIEANDSLKDADTQTTLLVLDNPDGGETPIDSALPIIGYTLAVVGGNQVFIHFSEPVTTVDGKPLKNSDFTISGHTTSEPIRPVSSGKKGTQEILLVLDADITVQEILNQNQLSVSDSVTDTATNPLRSRSHRISDLGLAPLDDPVVAPVRAAAQFFRDSAFTITMAIAEDSSGKRVQPQDINLEVQTLPVLVSQAVDLYICTETETELRSSQLWLQSFETHTERVPAPNLQVSRQSGSRSTFIKSINGNHLWNFRLPAELWFSDSAKRNLTGSRIEFIFELTGLSADSPVLYWGHLPYPDAADWYRHVRPWKIDIIYK